MAIKNIIFDLIGVLLRFDKSKLSSAIVRIGGTITTTDTDQAKNLLERFTHGQINEADFREQFKLLHDIEASDEQFDQAWISALVDIPNECFKLLKQLKQQGFNLYLLANTNPIHFRAIQTIIARDCTEAEWQRLFSAQYFSHQTEKGKSTKAAYEQVINENQLNPEDTYMVDDTFGFIEAARTVGLKTWYVSDKTPLRAFVETIGPDHYYVAEWEPDEDLAATPTAQ